MKISYLDRRRVIETVGVAQDIDWAQWLHPADKWRVIPAELMGEECKARMLLGGEYRSGLRLPWLNLDGKVLIRPGKLAVWTGWSHHGKSQMLKQLMLSAIGQGEKVLICSMEDDIEDVWRDLAIMYTGGSNPTPRALDEFIEFIAGNLWLYDQHGIVDENRMQALLRYASAELKTTQAVVDSLMMLRVNRDDYDAQSRFVGELKSVAKDTAQTIHLVAHMRKRDGKTGDDQPGHVHDIAGGHEIASKADYVFNVWRDKARKDLSFPSCLLGVEKQRGQINWLGRVGLDFLPGSRQFVDVGRSAMTFRQREPGQEG